MGVNKAEALLPMFCNSSFQTRGRKLLEIQKDFCKGTLTIKVISPDYPLVKFQS